MTIEEKAKRFDETLEQLKGLIEVTREDKCDIAKEDIIDIFPELKESEDERIMKAIHIYLDWLDGRKDYAPRGEYTIRDMIAWLEKQGEPTDINPSEFDLRLNKLLKQFETLSKEELTSSLSFYLNVIQNDGTYREEKQGEQKPTDKVEPKFHKGGWVVDNAGYIWKIKGILNKFYILEGVEGDESRPTTEWADDTFHLWTIKDAKDGDVLAFDDNTIVIFKDLYNANTFHSYCYIEDGVFSISQDDMPDWWEGKGFHPATKEQRDLLFQKMKEAGYEWDAEKKELKKIEQKPNDKVVPKFKVGDKVIGIISGMQYYITKVCDNHYCTESGCIIMFDAQDNFELVEQQLKKIEQKSTDKVEPKFHKGEWIVWQDKCYKVNYNGCGYELVDQNGLSTSLEYGTINENAHIWDIAKDAKNGDVMHSTGFHNDCIFIFDGLDNWKFDEPNGDRVIATAHCCLTLSADNMEFDIQGPDCIEVNTIKPATKEQRDILMKAMADAGYAFDFKKLEPKKIVVPIFNIGDTIVEKDLDECGYGTIKDIKNGQYIFY